MKLLYNFPSVRISNGAKDERWHIYDVGLRPNTDWQKPFLSLKAEERALNSPKQSGYSVKSPDKSGQNFTPQMGVYAVIIYTH